MTLIVQVPPIQDQGSGRPATAARSLVESGIGIPAMGGRLRMLVACAPAERARAGLDLGRVADRVARWADRLTRFSDSSELSALNRRPGAATTAVGPTLGAVLAWGRAAGRATDGVVDVTLLDARLSAETGPRHPSLDRPATGADRWRLSPAHAGRGATVERDATIRFDLDGVAKGWIADRALTLLARYPAALVDADGDIAIRTDPRTGWLVSVADPTDASVELARIRPDALGAGTIGIATSGTTVHRWGDDAARHHLVDPATRRSAVTDLEQCTVIADTTALAEAVAKAIVIRGTGSAETLLARPGIRGAILLRTSGEVLATSEVLAWLA